MPRLTAQFSEMKAGPAWQPWEPMTPASFRPIFARSVGTLPRRLIVTCFRLLLEQTFTKTLISCFLRVHVRGYPGLH
jgi:hypothetical protein